MVAFILCPCSYIIIIIIYKEKNNSKCATSSSRWKSIKCEPLTVWKCVGCAHTCLKTRLWHWFVCVIYQHRHVHTISKMKPRSKDLPGDMNAGKNAFHVFYTQRSSYCTSALVRKHTYTQLWCGKIPRASPDLQSHDLVSLP